MKKRILLYVWMIVGNFIFPFMNVLFPYLYWKQNQRTEDAAFTKEACNLLNFQILFSFIMIGVFVFGWYQAIVGCSMDEAASFGFMKWGLVVMTMVNIIYPLVVMLITSVGKKTFRAWPPTIPFFRAWTSDVYFRLMESDGHCAFTCVKERKNRGKVNWLNFYIWNFMLFLD